MPTYTLSTIQPFRDKTHGAQLRYLRVNGPASYATGGDTISPTAFGLSKVFIWNGAVFNNGTVAILAQYIRSTGKLKFFDMTGAEVANATDLSAYFCDVEVVGQ